MQNVAVEPSLSFLRGDRDTASVIRFEKILIFPVGEAAGSGRRGGIEAGGRKSPLGFLVGGPGGTGEILGFDFIDIEPGGAFAHGLQYVLKRRRFLFDPAQGIDAGDHK